MRVRKVDSNQKEIVRRMRLIPHLSVTHIHTIGKGVPDLLVGYEGVNYIFEIKDGTLPPSKRRLTEDEKKFHDEWNGTIHVIEYFDDVLMVLKIA